ncbi:YHYH domain-containing protein [Massilia sp. IC2-278]|uniref:YHYH domain-containing protein n=1 Tax=Massilia sp. IC2-278 TaxID=2887200 RepID=UPI0028136D28|nr:YHYH domain-containing protein [Massilia sp. IC2-278]
MGGIAEYSENRKRKQQLSLLFLALGLVTGSEALAHGGGLNAQGCHNNRKTGDYHCHRAPQVSAPRPSQSVANEPSRKRESQQLVTPSQAQRLQNNRPTGSTCYTGPRGGTYTLTASGRKNYSGC